MKDSSLHSGLNLVGHTLQLSVKDKRKGGNIVRTVEVLCEFRDDQQIRWYQVKEIQSKKTFAAKADIYDKLFLNKKETIKPKNTRVTIHNTGNPDYKKSR